MSSYVTDTTSANLNEALLAPPLAEGKYVVSSLAPGINSPCLDIPSQHASDPEGEIQHMFCNGTAFQILEFKLDPTRENRYTINASLLGEKFLDITDNDARDGRLVKFARHRDSAFQRWKLKPLAGSNKDFKIQNDGSGLFMDLRGQEPEAGGHIQQRPENTSPNQNWRITPA